MSRTNIFRVSYKEIFRKKLFLISDKSNQETSAKESVLNTASVLALDPLHDFRVDEKVTLRIYSSYSWNKVIFKLMLY